MVLTAGALYVLQANMAVNVGGGGGSIVIRSSTPPSYWAQFTRVDPVRDSDKFARVMLNDTTARGLTAYAGGRVLVQGRFPFA